MSIQGVDGGLSKLWSLLGPYYKTGPNTGPNLGDPKRDHNFDNSPDEGMGKELGAVSLGFLAVIGFRVQGVGLKLQQGWELESEKESQLEFEMKSAQTQKPAPYSLCKA